MYRAEDSDWGKSTSAWFADPAEADKPFKEIHKHRIEVLGRGQQFVAYHVHPDTGKPYEWVDFFGGLTEFAANALPTITKEQVEEAIKAFERMAEEHGFVRVKSHVLVLLTSSELADEEDLLMTLCRPLPRTGRRSDKSFRTYGRGTRLCSCENSKSRIGALTSSEFDGSDVALELWNEWSSTASNYVSFEELEYRWGTFSGTGSTIITAHWLLKTGRESKQAKLRLEKRQILADIKNQIADCRDQQEQVVAEGVAGTDLALRTNCRDLSVSASSKLTKISISAREVNIAKTSKT